MSIEADSILRGLDTKARVETPEQIWFEYGLAGPAQRGLAWLVDLLIRVILIVAVIMILGAAGAVSADDAFVGTGQGVLLVLVFVLEWGYYVFFDLIWSGRSPGKRAVGIRVVRDDGSALRFTESAVRNLLRAADSLPAAYLVGAVVSGFDPQFRRLGDLAAGTLVVRDETRGQRLPADDGGPDASGRHTLPQLGLSRAERQAISLFAARRKQLSHSRANELANMLAPVLSDRLGEPAPNEPAAFLVDIHRQMVRR